MSRVCPKLRKELEGVWNLVSGCHAFSYLRGDTEFKEAPGLVNKYRDEES